jgi:hypothetical protein
VKEPYCVCRVLFCVECCVFLLGERERTRSKLINLSKVT